MCIRDSFSASCTLVVNPPACHPLQAHLVLESHLPFRLILYWIRLWLDTGRDLEDTSPKHRGLLAFCRVSSGNPSSERGLWLHLNRSVSRRGECSIFPVAILC